METGAAGAKAAKSQRKTSKEGESKASGAARSYLIPAIIIIAVIAMAIVLGLIVSQSVGGGGQQNLQGFQNKFYAAPRVAIYVMNSSQFSYSDNCANYLIQKLILSQAHHRNASTIDLMVVANSTSCLGPNGPLGSANGTKVMPLSSCLAVSNGEPSVFINYSSTNSTSIMSGNLYTSGDSLFLSECGIASELG
jgi:hypothetical protein